jgi:hypothetical protein
MGPAPDTVLSQFGQFDGGFRKVSKREQRGYIEIWLATPDGSFAQSRSKIDGPGLPPKLGPFLFC